MDKGDLRNDKMSHRLGVSGSVILGNPDQFDELFWEGIDHIEIGEFQDEAAFRYFLGLRQEKRVSYGLHSPLYRNRSKYDLIEKIHYDPQYAWEQLDHEAELMASLGAEYILVHFPYFKHEVTHDVHQLIENGLQRLNEIQVKHKIQIVCEPKLGFQASPAGIHYLHSFPTEIWENYQIKLCIDIGDYLIATEDEILYYLERWKKHIKVVHLHNVQFIQEKYFWIPVHPSHANSTNHYSIEKIIRFLADCEDVIFVFEHTPHTKLTKQFVEEGYHWVESLLRNSKTSWSNPLNHG